MSPATGQLSLFDADVVPALPDDLEGLLAGPGQVVRLGGTARISVVVAETWRARALLVEFAERGLSGSGSRQPPPPDPAADPARGDEPAATTAPNVGTNGGGTHDGGTHDGTHDGGANNGGTNGGASHDGTAGSAAGSEAAAVVGHIGVRTAFSACLAPIAASWIRGAVTLPPEGFQLDGAMLRLWFIAAGRVSGPPGGATQGVTLRLSPGEETAWRAVRAALARLGLPVALVGPRAGGPAFRVVGRRRVARFVELVGSRPELVPPEAWPVSFRPSVAREPGIHARNSR